ncbi:crossover junction endodeoxyribonuclease RuvC [Candidatus Chromulinivorax destructor]|uniref:Crossover junction endodeoxyribonuclease RuvC n=1 Tax=Candidatus Chromulinivorax destructor TaxID=2066483 RepID=A0A345ZAA9_9BACT|nr:crossover junction endodeoxyribonuclease RuvC [Candidatus Chromulinivorax destructor]AXK60226.1 crossover junction endodeoxyribonuclease RuvC [Candidatus Chromulinivorax destructor]
MVILGIDPGFSVTGYSILKKQSGLTAGLKNKNQITLLDHGFLKMSAAQSLSVKVGIFHDLFTEKIKLHGVTVISLETPFLGKNAQTFLKLGYLRGILYLLAQQHGLAICEFAPREVKQNVTGYGAATKEQVAQVLSMLFPQIPKPLKEDVTDAIAISLCGLWQSERKHL